MDNTFYKLTTQEIINLKNEGILNTQTFIYFYLRSLDPFGNQSINIDRQQFCQQFGISISSFKRAVKKLRERKAFKFVKSLLITSEPLEVKSEPLTSPELLPNNDFSDSKIKDIKIKDNKLEEKEKKENYQQQQEDIDRVVINEKNKVTTKQQGEVTQNKQTIEQQKEVIENEPLPEKPYEHEPLIRFVTAEFVQNYNEPRERAKENAIKHLSKRDKAIKKWREYQKYIQAKNLSDRRSQELLERKYKEQRTPVNLKALEMLSEFTKALKTKRS